MHQFHVRRLVAEDARVAYPLVRSAEPAVPLDAWLGYVRRAARPASVRTGIMMATRDGQRFPSGLFCYRHHADLVLGSLVTADYFVAVDILDPAPVVGAMVRELEQLGERLGCDAVRSIVHNQADLMARHLERCGYRREATNFVKHLRRPVARAARA
jgi:hypothetical protein